MAPTRLPPRHLVVFRTRSRHTFSFAPAAVFDLPLLELQALAPDATLSLALIASQLVGAPPQPAAALRAQLSAFAPAAFAGAVVALGMLAPLRRGWLERRTLNANFYYAATVAHGAAQTYPLYDVAAAAVARDLRSVLPPAATRIQRVWRRHRPRGAPKRGRRRRKSE